MRALVLLTMFLTVAVSAVAEPPVVPCDSMGERIECRVAAHGKIAIVDERSENLCFEAITWGTASPGVVWVDRGCRATFTTLQKELPPRRVVCESLGGETVCPADLSAGATLVEQLSRSACILGKTWGLGTSGKDIWVDGGCRAVFALDRSSVPRQSETLEATVVCEASGRKRSDCPANTGGGVQLVRQLGDDACRYGRTWGYDAKGVWVSNGCRAEFAVRRNEKPVARVVSCESMPGKTERCAADTRYGVALVRQLGGVCTQGRSWDFTESEVWVSDGCRAQFALGGFRLAPEAVPPGAAKVVCESDGKRTECEIGANRGVGLVRQIGETDCVLNRNWGYGSGLIWVDQGCRAEFVVAR
ncbi:MAG: DUF3011 domain-containing protein [Thermoanaerobaculia bacterium]